MLTQAVIAGASAVADTGSPARPATASQAVLDERKARYFHAASMSGSGIPATLWLPCASPMTVCGASSSAPCAVAASDRRLAACRAVPPAS